MRADASLMHGLIDMAKYSWQESSMWKERQQQQLSRVTCRSACYSRHEHIMCRVSRRDSKRFFSSNSTLIDSITSTCPVSSLSLPTIPSTPSFRMTKCLRNPMHNHQYNPCKDLADGLWKAPSVLSTELERFRNTYVPFTQHCGACVTQLHEYHYLHCLKEMDAAASKFKRAKEALEDKIKDG